MKSLSFDELSQMSDAELGEVLGHGQEISEFRSGLKAINGLKGKALNDAKSDVERMLQPHVHAGELKYIARSAERRNKTGKQELEDDDPASVM